MSSTVMLVPRVLAQGTGSAGPPGTAGTSLPSENFALRDEWGAGRLHTEQRRPQGRGGGVPVRAHGALCH